MFMINIYFYNIMIIIYEVLINYMGFKCNFANYMDLIYTLTHSTNNNKKSLKQLKCFSK